MQLIQYNSAAMFVGPSQAVGTHGPTNILPLYGIQSATFDFGEPFGDVEGAEGSFERVRVSPNEVNLSFAYLIRDGANEENMGILVDGTGAAFANLWSNERNYFVAMRNDRQDILQYSGYDSTVVAFGQGCLNSYGITATIGAPLQANASLSFLNVGVASSGLDVQLPVVNKQDGSTIISYGFDNYFYTGSGDSTTGDDYSAFFTGSGNNSSSDILVYSFSGSGATSDWASLDTLYTLPALSFHNTPFYAVGPGDMTLQIPEDATFAAIVSGTNACIIQSFQLNAALVRNTDQPLGWVYPRNRLLDPPIEVKLTVNAFVNKYKVGLLNERICNNSGQTIELVIASRCTGESVNHLFTGDGSGIDWTNDGYSFLFTGDGQNIDWANDYYSYLYTNSSDTIRYRLDGARLDSTSVNMSIGDFQQVTFNWSAKIFTQNATGVNFGNLNITAPSA